MTKYEAWEARLAPWLLGTLIFWIHSFPGLHGSLAAAWQAGAQKSAARGLRQEALADFRAAAEMGPDDFADFYEEAAARFHGRDNFRFHLRRTFARPGRYWAPFQDFTRFLHFQPSPFDEAVSSARDSLFPPTAGAFLRHPQPP